MWEKRKKEAQLGLWIEAERERLSARAYALEDAFLRAFFAQCVESTAADAYEVFLETPLAYNYFRENLGRMNEKTLARFFKLAAIYHTIRTIRRRKSGLDWTRMWTGLTAVFSLSGQERKMTELLHCCAELYQSGFQELFHKTTARYLFGDKTLSGFSFAFIGNFWYNSYSSFMSSFTGYVPFHIRLKRAQ